MAAMDVDMSEEKVEVEEEERSGEDAWPSFFFEEKGPRAAARLVQRVHPAHYAGDRRCGDRLP